MALNQRPLSIGEILDRTVQIYRRNFLPLVSITAPPAAAMVLFFGAFGIFFAKQFFTAKPDPANFFAIFLVFGLLMLVGIPFMLAVVALSLGAANHAVLCAHREEKITIRASYAYALKHFWRFVWLLFLQALFAFVIPGFVIGFVVAVLAGFTAVLGKSAGAALPVLLAGLIVLLYLGMVVAFIWIWLRYSLAFPATVAEEKPAWPAMGRSVQLSKGSRGRIFVMFLLVWIMTIAVSLVLSMPVDLGITLLFRKPIASGSAPAGLLVAIQVVNMGVNFLVRTLVTPIYATALMLFYFDQRTRIEGYDIELLMAQAGWGQLPAPPVAVEQSPNEAAPWGQAGIETPAPEAAAQLPVDSAGSGDRAPEHSEPAAE